MKNRWDVTVAASNYHWDPNANDSNTIRIISNVFDEWNDEIERAIELQKPVISDGTIEKHISAGTHMYNGVIVDTTEFPILGSIGKKLGFEEYNTSIQTQTTGMTTPLHIDSSSGDKERVIVMLQDWYWGQILQFGNIVLHNWKAGDVLYFSINGTPHSTANLSPHSRTIAKITGRTTDAFEKLLKRESQ